MKFGTKANIFYSFGHIVTSIFLFEFLCVFFSSFDWTAAGSQLFLFVRIQSKLKCRPHLKYMH